MLHLMQIINHMFKLGYSHFDIDCAFTDVLNGDVLFQDLLDELGIEMTQYQLDRTVPKLHLYESALAVLKLKHTG